MDSSKKPRNKASLFVPDKSATRKSTAVRVFPDDTSHGLVGFNQNDTSVSLQNSANSTNSQPSQATQKSTNLADFSDSETSNSADFSQTDVPKPASNSADFSRINVPKPASRSVFSQTNVPKQASKSDFTQIDASKLASDSAVFSQTNASETASKSDIFSQTDTSKLASRSDIFSQIEASETASKSDFSQIEASETAEESDSKCESYALWYISNYPCSEAKLTKKLSEKGYNLGEIEKIVTKFKDLGYLDDLKLAQSMLPSLARRLWGEYRICLYLKEKGFGRETIENLDFSEIDFDNLCQKLAAKYPPSRRNAMLRALFANGFSRSQIERATAITFDD